MKKILNLFFFCFSFFIFISTTYIAFATSGACSSHGGVNCSAGADWDGSVICNDGWTYSSVSYYSMTKCQGSSLYYPSYTFDYDYNLSDYSYTSCPLHSTYSYLYDSCQCNSNYYADGNTCKSYDDLCEDLVGYNSSYDSLYNTCVCDYGYILDGDDECINYDDYCEENYGLHSSYSSLNDTCECDYGYEFNSLNQCVYKSSDYSYGLDSILLPDYYLNNYDSSYTSCPDNSYLGTGGSCYCNDGYGVNDDGDGCITMDTWCSNEYGSHISYNGEVCECNDGYYFDEDENKCLTMDSWCEDNNGEHSYYDGSVCICEDGYFLDFVAGECTEGQEEEKIIETEIDDEDKNEIIFDENLFTDISSSKNKNAVLYLANKGIVNGYDDSTFKPDKEINRAELLKILIEGSGQIPTNDDKDCFTDVNDEWYAKYICYAKNIGIVNGYEDGSFKPEQTVTKAESIKMLLEAWDFVIPEDIEAKPFNDISVDDWYAPYVNYAKDLGVLEETGVLFFPLAEMNRGGICENLYLLLIR